MLTSLGGKETTETTLVKSHGQSNLLLSVLNPNNFYILQIVTSIDVHIGTYIHM